MEEWEGMIGGKIISNNNIFALGNLPTPHPNLILIIGVLGLPVMGVVEEGAVIDHLEARVEAHLQIPPPFHLGVLLGKLGVEMVGMMGIIAPKEVSYLIGVV